jgi:hypothetical protein
MLKAYVYHKPSPEAIKNIGLAREMFSEVAEAIERAVPPSRERSLALTKVEEAAMWMNKAITHNDPESVPE